MSIDRIRAYIQEEILDDTGVELDLDQDLLLSETLDSLGVTRLVAFIETELGVQVPAQDVTLEHFGSLRQIQDYLASRGS